MSAHRFHPLADLFPLLEGAELDALAADIKANGLRETIVLAGDGSILDGRNRYLACKAAGASPRFESYRGTDPLGFVISKNLHRRHLNESQRAMVAARVANLAHGGDRRSDQAANLPLEVPVAEVGQARAAEMLNVSPRSVRDAKAVQEKGSPELARAVDQGKLAVSAAAKAATLTPETQAKIASEAEQGRANVVRNVIKRETRAVREQDLGRRQCALPDRKYGVIVEDYEWDHVVWSRDTGMDRHAGNHYPVGEDAHTAAEIVERTKDRFAVAADDCVLFMWSTLQHAAIAIDVLRLRGFAYVSQYAWGKDKIGLGFWNRNKHEIFLIGVRGNIPCPAPGTQRDSLIMASVGPHSAKPEAFLEMIESYYPTLPKLELNRRGPARPGWDAWGAEATKAEPDEGSDDPAPAPAADDWPEIPEGLRRVNEETPSWATHFRFHNSGSATSAGRGISMPAAPIAMKASKNWPFPSSTISTPAARG